MQAVLHQRLCGWCQHTEMHEKWCVKHIVKQYRKQQGFSDDSSVKNAKNNRTFYDVKKRTSSCIAKGFLLYLETYSVERYNYSKYYIKITFEAGVYSCTKNL